MSGLPDLCNDTRAHKLNRGIWECLSRLTGAISQVCYEEEKEYREERERDVRMRARKLPLLPLTLNPVRTSLGAIHVP